MFNEVQTQIISKHQATHYRWELSSKNNEVLLLKGGDIPFILWEENGQIEFLSANDFKGHIPEGFYPIKS